MFAKPLQNIKRLDGWLARGVVVRAKFVYNVSMNSNVRCEIYARCNCGSWDCIQSIIRVWNLEKTVAQKDCVLKNVNHVEEKQEVVQLHKKISQVMQMC